MRAHLLKDTNNKFEAIFIVKFMYTTDIITGVFYINYTNKIWSFHF